MDLTNALWITLIGMGLVFLAILLLWGLMALIVRLTAAPEESTPEVAAPVQAVDPGAGLLSERKRRAAAAGVAAAIALRSRGAKAVRPTPGSQAGSALSAWQAVNRARGLGQRGNSSRKKVVS